MSNTNTKTMTMADEFARIASTRDERLLEERVTTVLSVLKAAANDGRFHYDLQHYSTHYRSFITKDIGHYFYNTTGSILRQRLLDFGFTITTIIVPTVRGDCASFERISWAPDRTHNASSSDSIAKEGSS